MRNLIKNYTFNKSTKQITFTDYASIAIEKVFLVVNQTNGLTIYQPNDSTKGGTASSNVLTLAYDTTGASFNNSDKLQIFYEQEDASTSYTTSALGAGATYTSPTFDTVGGQPYLSFSAYSVTDLIIYYDESQDGTNWVTISSYYVTTKNSSSNYASHKLSTRYGRIRAVNSVTANAGGIANLFIACRLDNLGTERAVQVVDKFDEKITIDKNWGLRVQTAEDTDTFGAGVSHARNTHISANFSYPLANSDITSTVTGTGSNTQANGSAVIASGSGTTASAILQTNSVVAEIPGREIYAMFTAAFTVPTSANSYQRIGLYDANNGYFFGYSGTTFGVTRRQNGVDVEFIPRSSFNGDSVLGNVNSFYTRSSAPEVFNPALKNVFRIRFGWLGAACIVFEIMSPDGMWVRLHTIKYPNTAIEAHIYNPNLPLTAEVSKTSADSTNLQISSSSWDAGIVDAPGQDITYTGSIAASNAAVTTNTASKATLSFNLTGTWSGTLVVEGHNGDLQWTQINSYNLSGGIASVISSNQFLYVNASVYEQVRIRAASWSSGTATIQTAASVAPIFTFNQPIVSASYSAVFSGAVTAAAATDVLTITGAANKVIRILRIGFSGTQTTNGYASVSVVKRSTANSGGTSTSLTAVPMDSNTGAASATVLAYTANPTTGTLVGRVRSGKVAITEATQSNQILSPTTTIFDFTFNESRAQPPTLRGTSQVLAVNLNGVSLTGNSCDIFVEWIEE